jgi:diguanylate cyclase (GGDEF)-like protein
VFSPGLALWLLSAQVDFAPAPGAVNARLLAGVGACLVIAFLLLVYSYRRRIYVLYWLAGWSFVAASMFLAAGRYGPLKLEFLIYGLSQFCSVAAAISFVMAADAYDAPPRLPHWYVRSLLLMFIWFSLAPVSLGPQAVFASGHLIAAGTLCAAGAGYFAVARRTRLVGAALVGSTLVLVAASHVWIAFWVASPSDIEAGRALFVAFGFYLLAALGMQLMTFEDMTLELRGTNRRLEAAQTELQQMVMTDPLTGCRNRRFFEQVIGRELKRHRRGEIPMAFLFVDIDKFKVINDGLGHETGDRVLQQVASFLARNVRGADYVFRWGGDEFLLMLSCTEDQAQRRADAVREAFLVSEEAARLPSGVGLSIGCVEVPLDTQDVLQYVKVADERMYEHKRTAKR